MCARAYATAHLHTLVRNISSVPSRLSHLVLRQPLAFFASHRARRLCGRASHSHAVFPWLFSIPPSRFAMSRISCWNVSAPEWRHNFHVEEPGTPPRSVNALSGHTSVGVIVVVVVVLQRTTNFHARPMRKSRSRCVSVTLLRHGSTTWPENDYPD